MRAEELEQVLYELYRGEGGMTAVELTQKELRKLRITLRASEQKANVSEQELENIRDKIRLKEQILEILGELE